MSYVLEPAVVTASMEPGFHKPGNTTLANTPVVNGYASMEPGFHKPGNEKPPKTNRLPRVSLQWSRAFISPETQPAHST